MSAYLSGPSLKHANVPVAIPFMATADRGETRICSVPDLNLYAET